MRTILISAYGCEPLKGSEAGVGWNWILQMAKTNYLHVITRANNQDSIEAHLPQDVKDRITFYYYDTPNFIKRMKNKAKGLYFYYFCWQLGIISLVRCILKQNKIDYTLHLTFGSMWMPTFLPFFKTPFIWGPVGGGDCEPKSFLKVLPLKQRIIQSARYAMNVLSFLHPSIIIPSAKAKAILVRTPNSANVIPSYFRKKTKVILETAMEDTIFALHKIVRQDKHGLQLITTGRLLPNKNILTAVKSLQYLPRNQNITLTIVGSGYQKKEIEEIAQKIGWKSNVSIIAELPRQEVLKLVEQSDIFLFPSLREGGSWSLMEAMAIGLPIICLDWAGMSVTTDNDCAIRLPVSNPEQMPKDMAAAIIKLIENPELRRQMGEAGRKRIKEVFTWKEKGRFMENLFKELDAKK